jgi:RHS repeat-associated protein
METDGEVSGNGNSYTTEFRQYDPRLGRWKSLDPLMAQFPWMSPYVAFDNNPVFYNDPYGLASEVVNESGGDGEPEKRTNPKTGTVYTKDNDGHWVQNIDEVKVTPKKGFGAVEGLAFDVFIDSKQWESSSSFYGAGKSVMTITPPFLPKYYHPLQEAMAGTPSEDRITSNGFMFVANESINSGTFAGAMMGGLKSGAGPENFYFGVNSSVSKAMINSEIVHNAMMDFQDKNKDYKDGDGITPLDWAHYSQSVLNLGLSAFGSLNEGGGSAATVENFIGGAAVKITPLRKAEAGYIIVRVSIFNVTSVGSGNAANGKSKPRSILNNSPEPFTNISQTIEFDAKVKL